MLKFALVTAAAAEESAEKKHEWVNSSNILNIQRKVINFPPLTRPVASGTQYIFWNKQTSPDPQCFITDGDILSGNELKVIQSLC